MHFLSEEYGQTKNISVLNKNIFLLKNLCTLALFATKTWPCFVTRSFFALSGSASEKEGKKKNFFSIAWRIFGPTEEATVRPTLTNNR